MLWKIPGFLLGRRNGQEGESPLGYCKIRQAELSLPVGSECFWCALAIFPAII